MKKIVLMLVVLLFTGSAFAYDVPKNEEYYKTQIQNQRLLYNEMGLVNAIQQKKPDVVQLYMEAGFDPNTSYMGTPMLIFAIYCKQPKIVKILLDAGANPEVTVPPLFVTTRSTNALVYSIKRKSSESVQYLVDHKVDVNKNLHGLSPINYALDRKQTKIVEILLKAGAKPDERAYKKVAKSKDEYLKDMFAESKGKL